MNYISNSKKYQTKLYNSSTLLNLPLSIREEGKLALGELIKDITGYLHKPIKLFEYA